MRISNLLIRKMRLVDLDQVREVDTLSFTLPWSRNAYQYEIQENKSSRSWVAEFESEINVRQVVGLAVVWIVLDEAHIATIAVHPSYRQMGIAARIMGHIIKDVKKLNLNTVTLEVRESNEIALNLYLKYKFEFVGRRPRYYHDTNEDALIMTLKLLDSG